MSENTMPSTENTLPARLLRQADVIAADVYTGHDWPNTQEELDLLNAAALMRKASAALSSPPAQRELDITLDEEQVEFLRSFIGDDEGEAPMPIRLQFGEGHSGRGLYVSSRDYPEEGSSLLVADRASLAAATGSKT